MIATYLALLALTAAVFLGGRWWWRGRAPGPKEVEWPEVMAGAESGGYGLITTGEVAQRYRRDPQSLLLVDTRPAGEYRAGHIRGAVNLPLTPTRWGRWRSRRLLAALLGADKERLAVFY
jgi:3-mercaptopyruvate sulfurtransferase SseA